MTMPPLHVMWEDASGNIVHGFDPVNGVWVDQPFISGLAFTDAPGGAVMVQFRSSASFLQSPETLLNVRLYLTGQDPGTLNLLATQWPPAAGLDISFDNGVSWTRFSITAGNANDSTTWIPMPGAAVSSVAPDGQIGPNDVATATLRLTVAPGTTDFGIYLFQIGIDFDVQ